MSRRRAAPHQDAAPFPLCLVWPGLRAVPALQAPTSAAARCNLAARPPHPRNALHPPAAVEMEFSGLRTPLGRRFVPPGFLTAAEAAPEDGGLGSRYAFHQRFYSTLPPTLENELRVGRCPPSRCVAAPAAPCSP